MYFSLTLRMTTVQVSKRESLSTTTVLFRTTFTRRIKLNLLLKWLLGSNLSQIYNSTLTSSLLFILLVVSSWGFISVTGGLWLVFRESSSSFKDWECTRDLLTDIRTWKGKRQNLPQGQSLQFWWEIRRYIPYTIQYSRFEVVVAAE